MIGLIILLPFSLQRTLSQLLLRSDNLHNAPQTCVCAFPPPRSWYEHFSYLLGCIGFLLKSLLIFGGGIQYTMLLFCFVLFFQISSSYSKLCLGRYTLWGIFNPNNKPIVTISLVSFQVRALSWPQPGFAALFVLILLGTISDPWNLGKA